MSFEGNAQGMPGIPLENRSRGSRGVSDHHFLHLCIQETFDPTDHIKIAIQNRVRGLRVGVSDHHAWAVAQWNWDVA